MVALSAKMGKKKKSTSVKLKKKVLSKVYHIDNPNTRGQTVLLWVRWLFTGSILFANPVLGHSLHFNFVHRL